jgi:regulator of nucleoside diphosphate kinase
MSPDTLPPLSIPARDYRKLHYVAERAVRDNHPVGPFLMAELLRANICEDDELPPDTVRLNHWVSYRMDTGWPAESRILVCPADLRNRAAQLSILSPVGAALIGLRAGSCMPYRSIEGVRHMTTAESLTPPPGVMTLFPGPAASVKRPGASAPGAFDDPDDDGPSAA